MRDEELREQSEKYLNDKIPDILWEIEKRKAECKLERIIQREGDANGEKKLLFGPAYSGGNSGGCLFNAVYEKF